MDARIQAMYDETEMASIIKLAAEAGAKKALSDIGLHDEQAGKDVEEIRSLLEAWRAAKTAAWDTTVRFLTGALLAALAIGVYLKSKS